MVLALKIMEKEISLTKDIPIVFVTYIDVDIVSKDTMFTKMCGHNAYRNKCTEK